MPNAFSISGKKNPTLTIATRGSTLALWQANWVREKILEQHSEINVVLLNEPEEIFPVFEDAYKRDSSSMIIEWGDYYNEK